MKNLSISFFSIFSLIFCSLTKGQNDSLRRIDSLNGLPRPVDVPHFIFGLSGAPDHTYNVYIFGDENGGYEVHNDRKLSFGGEGELFAGFEKRKMQVTFGIGYAYLSSKYSHKYSNGGSNNSFSTDNFTLHEEFYKISFNLNWLVGDKNRWIVGMKTEYGLLSSFKEVFHLENNPYVVNPNYTYNYRTPQNTIWAGFNFGRLFKINKHIDFSIVFNTKISSLILGRPQKACSSGHDYDYRSLECDGTADRNLFVKTLNINFIFK
jgi:hypothetical protein